MAIDFKNIKQIINKEIDAFKSIEYVSEQEGKVISVGDGIAKVSGLSAVMLNEIVIFETGVSGIVLNLEQDVIGVVLLGKYDNIEQNHSVYRTYKVFEIPVGFDFIGRIIDANAKPIDGKGAIKAEAYLPIEKIAPGVMARESVNEPLETGILSIDSMFPIGKGQRELIIGDRQTGKTTIATDTIINQKGKDVYCIYVAIGQKNSTISALVRNLEEQGAMAYTTVVSASASDLPALQYIAPYTGVTLAEYLMSKGKNVLIVYDDLSKHAIAYRTLSLLLKRPPGREAYPGDVFYLHSRLLERACKLNAKHGGGSITALPIIETQAGDISAYIPTNVISITDGQIFMMNSLFNSGQRPAIDAGLSVSRVGGAAQIKCVKQMASSLKLELANYRELDAFSQFGSDLDDATKYTLEHGQRIMYMLRQLPNEPYNQIDESILLFAIKERYVDMVPTDRIIDYKKFLLDHIKNTKIRDELADKKAFSPELTTSFKISVYDITLEFLNGIKNTISSEEYEIYKTNLDSLVKDLEKPKKVVSNPIMETVEETTTTNNEVEKEEQPIVINECNDSECDCVLTEKEKQIIDETIEFITIDKNNQPTSSTNKVEEINTVKNVHENPNPTTFNFDKLVEEESKDYFDNFEKNQNTINEVIKVENQIHETPKQVEPVVKNEQPKQLYTDKPYTKINSKWDFDKINDDPMKDAFTFNNPTPKKPVVNQDNNIFKNVSSSWGHKAISEDEKIKREERKFVATKKVDTSGDTPLTIMISLTRDEANKIIEEGKKALFFKKLPVQPVERVIIYLVKSNKNPGLVIGEFDIQKTIVCSKTKAWEELGSISTIRKKDFTEYYADSKKVHGMLIDDFYQYSIPKTLSDYGMEKGPSGFCYLK